MAFLDSVKFGIVIETDRFLKLRSVYHLMIGFCFRLFFVIYGSYHDQFSSVKYTDVDYFVYTDAARHALEGESPYQRRTFRYSAVLAWLLTPNILIHESYGKVLFCVFDILITICINRFIQRHLHNKVNAATVAKYCSLFWLYNPLSIAISTRGNADSLSCLIILMSLYCLQSYEGKYNVEYALSGMFLGLAIHLRLYPIFFSLPMYISLGDYVITSRTSPFKVLTSLLPNKKQCLLTVSTLFFCSALTFGLFYVYGYESIYETYLYHIFRKDPKHNFSLFFYYSYLRMGELSFDCLTFASTLLNCVLMCLISLAFGPDPQTLPFAVFCQAAILVIYNTVVTSQYFVWYLSLLPLVVQDISVGTKGALVLVGMWTGGQVIWLFYAYLLEFLNQPMFIVVYMACVFFFGSCVAVLYRLILSYTPGYNFGIGNISGQSKNK